VHVLNRMSHSLAFTLVLGRCMRFPHDRACSCWWLTWLTVAKRVTIRRWLLHRLHDAGVVFAWWLTEHDAAAWCMKLRSLQRIGARRESNIYPREITVIADRISHETNSPIIAIIAPAMHYQCPPLQSRRTVAFALH